MFVLLTITECVFAQDLFSLENYFWYSAIGDYADLFSSSNDPYVNFFFWISALVTISACQALDCRISPYAAFY